MTGKVWNQGERYQPVKKARPLDEVLVEHSTWVNSNNLRQRLLKEGVKEYKCECCGNTEWMGQPIALELHHVNGIKDDLRLENLQILCPNCHSFTDNYRGNDGAVLELVYRQVLNTWAHEGLRVQLPPASL